MTSIRNAAVLAAESQTPAAWEALAAEPDPPLSPLMRYRWVQKLPVLESRSLAVTALAVLRDQSAAAVRLHTKAVGVLYRTAKPSIGAAVARLSKRQYIGYGSGDVYKDAIMLVNDAVAKAIVQTTATSGGEWVVYVTMRINGQAANHMYRHVVREAKHFSLDALNTRTPTPNRIPPLLTDPTLLPTVDTITTIVQEAIQAVANNDRQACALEAMFAVGRFRGLGGDGTHSQAQAAALTGLSQQRISMLRSRLKAYLYDQLGVPNDECE